MVYISNNHFQNVAQAKQWRKKYAGQYALQLH